MRITSKDWPPFLVVASHKVLLVLNGSQYTLYQSDVKLYGMTWLGRYIYVSTRYFPEEKGTSNILRFDHNMTFVDKLRVKRLGSYVHELLAWQGMLYICNTDKANIIAYDLDTGKQRSIRWTHENVHLNCIWKYGNTFYVLEHRHEHSPKFIVILDDAFRRLATLPVHTGAQTSLTGFGVHNIFIVGGDYVTLGPFAVYRVNTSSGESVTTEQRLDGVVAGEHLLRGFAVLPGRCFLIGVSRVTGRSDRGVGDSRVLLTDTEFNVLDEFVVKDAGQVMSVRLLRNDLAHHNLPCPYQPDWR
jgi:hypothetical protein